MVERRDARTAAACAAAAGLAFLPAVRYPLLDWDDAVNVARNPHLNFSPSGLWWMLTGSSLGHWHPLTWLTLALDPGHATNVLLHALNAGLFYLVARRFLRSGAWFASLLWALHPLRAESVAWVSERRDVLSCAFLLGSTLAYLSGRKRWALALGASAMASKVFAVVLPAVLLVLDARLEGRPRWKEKLPWVLPAAVALAFNVAAQTASGAAVSWADFGLKARLAQAAYGLAFYAWKTVLPFGLGPLYERSLLLEPVPFVLAAVAVCAAAGFLWRERKRRPALAQAALVYFLLALPALGLFKSGRMTAADRYSYLPALPLSLLIAAALESLPLRAGVLASLACLTLLQLPVWSSDVALWTRACRVSPLSYFALLKKASAEQAAGRLEDAKADREEAARLHAEVFSRAADAYEARGDSAAAEAARESSRRGLQLNVP